MSKDQHGSTELRETPTAIVDAPPMPILASVECVECAEAIPSAARKCSRCGSYQNWRRHIPFSQSTLALVISFIALGSSLVVGSKAVVETMSGYLSVKDEWIGVAVVSLDERSARLFLSNPTETSIVIKDIMCGLHIPIDPDQMNRNLLASKREGETLTEVFLDHEDAIGLFLISYSVSGQAVLPPDGQILIEGSTKHITPPPTIVPPSANIRGDVKVGSYCTVGGVDEANEFAVGAVGLPVASVLDLDIEAFLQHADFSPDQQADKVDRLKQVEAVRLANRKARAEAEDTEQELKSSPEPSPEKRRY